MKAASRGLRRGIHGIVTNLSPSRDAGMAFCSGMDDLRDPQSGNSPSSPRLRMTFRGIVTACLVFAGGPFAAEAGDASQFESALSLYNARSYAAARQEFSGLLSLHPSSVDLRFYLGRIAVWFNEETEAMTLLEAAAVTAPADARIKNALGDAYGLAAQDAPLLLKPRWACKSRQAYERAIELDPRNVKYHMSLLGYCLVAPALVGGGLDRAHRVAAGIATLDPRYGRVALASVLISDHDIDGAFAQFDAVLQHYPDDYVALYHVGRCAALSHQRLDRGLAALRRCLLLPRPALADCPTAANIHERIGDLLELRGDHAGGEAEHRLARQLEPDFRPAKMMLLY